MLCGTRPEEGRRVGRYDYDASKAVKLNNAEVQLVFGCVTIHRISNVFGQHSLPCFWGQ